jgi:hypothetical protein
MSTRTKTNHGILRSSREFLFIEASLHRNNRFGIVGAALTISLLVFSASVCFAANEGKPEKCDPLNCYELRQQNEKGNLGSGHERRPYSYVIIFREKNASFDIPDHAPRAGQEILVCVDSPDRGSRYRLVFGSTEIGRSPTEQVSTTVGFDPGQSNLTSLRASNAGLPAVNEKEKEEFYDNCSTSDCEIVKGDIERITRAARNVANLRNSLALTLVDIGSRDVVNSHDIEVLESIPESLCSTVSSDSGSRFIEVNPPIRNSSQEGIEEEESNPPYYEPAKNCGERSGGRDAFPVSMESFIDNRTKEAIRIIDGYWQINNRKGETPAGEADEKGANGGATGGVATPPAATQPAGGKAEGAKPSEKPEDKDKNTAALNKLMEKRKEILLVLRDAMTGYERLTALASRIVGDSRRRTNVFRLGTFDENKVVSATLQRHKIGIRYSENKESIEQYTDTTSFSLGLNIPRTTWFQAQMGVLYSFTDRPVYDLETVNGARTIRETGSEVFFRPVLFANISWCPQDMSRIIYRRECAWDRSDAVRFIPGFSIGVPLSSELVEGNFFMGISLPYIPYVSIVSGLHLSRVSKLKNQYNVNSVVADDIASVGDVTTSTIKPGPFISLTITSEIFYLLYPPATPAK